MFQKMLILRAIRPDKIMVAVQNYVMAELGEEFVKPPSFDLSLCYEDSAIINPLVFVLSAGSDPMAGLLKFVSDQKATLNSISFGTGSRPKSCKIDRKCYERRVVGNFTELPSGHKLDARAGKDLRATKARWNAIRITGCGVQLIHRRIFPCLFYKMR